jgi:6-phosphogluconolactonase
MIHIYPDLKSLSQAAARLWTDRAAEAIHIHGRFVAAISGGTTPQRTYAILGQQAYRRAVDWSRVHLFWADERCVPLGDPRHNASVARSLWLDKTAIPPDQVHALDCLGDPARAARDYEQTLREFFKPHPPQFDLVFLGLGADGHTASLFPGSPALRARGRLAMEVQAKDADFRRVTLTPLALNRARSIVFLVAGTAKARILQRILSEPDAIPALPAQLIRSVSGEVHWLVDQKAADYLTSNLMA